MRFLLTVEQLVNVPWDLEHPTRRCHADQDLPSVDVVDYIGGTYHIPCVQKRLNPFELVLLRGHHDAFSVQNNQIRWFFELFFSQSHNPFGDDNDRNLVAVWVLEALRSIIQVQDALVFMISLQIADFAQKLIELYMLSFEPQKLRNCVKDLLEDLLVGLVAKILENSLREALLNQKY